MMDILITPEILKLDRYLGRDIFSIQVSTEIIFID